MKLRILLFSSLMLLSAGTAWADVEINETNFPDASFRNWLRNQEYGSDGKLTEAEIAGVTSISVTSMNIRSLKGIEYFTALQTLWCFSNQLTSLDVSKNTELTVLNCPLNLLTSLDVSKNIKLTELFCGGNQLTSLDVSENTALIDLRCEVNQLTSLNVSKNIKLIELECSYNQLSSIDVSKNTSLTTLSCSSNQLTSLDVSKNIWLTRLDCYQNKINGAGMDALVESLPTVSSGTMRVKYFTSDLNEMTNTQVSAAKVKRWTPYYTEEGTNWKEYAGVDPSTGVNNVEASETADSAPWYTINGTLLSGKPTEKGIYIHNGKKVLVK